MKPGGLTTIQQTLTKEPLIILNRSIEEASRRNHAQTTPLHVAATLLSSPTGIFRQVCLTSHPNSSHPLQCRALDLCFRVALERLPSSPHKVSEPPLSNALTAALKRAQAHQRRGLPENQQQPLLAVKVELEQLIVSILDDPSVSKVMREASFSSPAVKAAIEQSMMVVHNTSYPSIGIRFPALTSKQGSDEVKRVIQIMMRRKRRNPILVGDEQPAAAVEKEVVRMIETERLLKNAEVIRFSPIKELGFQIESRIRTSMNQNRGIVLDLGDLRWLVEESAPEIVAEMRKLLTSIGEDDGLWLIGTANCETYLRCQVYHSSLERDWDLQAVPIASKSSSSPLLLQGIIPFPSRVGAIGNENPYLNPLIPLKRSTMALPVLVPDKVAGKLKCCPMCFRNYEEELKERRNSSEVANRPPPLPRWLQDAKADKQHEGHSKNKEEEEDQILPGRLEEQLQKKWRDKCLQIHPSFHHPNFEFPKPKLQSTTAKILGKTLQLSMNNLSPPSSPVRTDLVLGHEKTDMDCIKDILGCISSELQTEKVFSKGEDADSFKKLLNDLIEKSWWQRHAASELATTVTRARSGNGKRRDGAIRGYLWLLFAGPDRISKMKMASVLAEQISGSGSKPVVVCLGSSRAWSYEDDEESTVRLRGKTALDRIVEAVRRNPNSVIVLEDIDEADMLIRGSIRSAMERGRLTDSHGREISLGNIIFILTAKPDEIRNVEDPDESKYGRKCNWQIRVSVNERFTKKRRANRLDDDGEEEEEDRSKMRKTTGHGLSLDLNQLAGAAEDDDDDGSQNSSDIVTEERNNENRRLTMTTVPHDLAIHLDGTIVFKPVDFGAIRREIERRIQECFSGAVGKEHTIEFDGAAMEKLVGESWLGRIRLNEWIEKVLSPSFEQIRSRFSDERTTAVVQLRLDGSGCGSDLRGEVRLDDRVIR